MSKVLFLTLLFWGSLFIYPQIYKEVKAQELIIKPSELSNRNASGIDIEVSNLIPERRYSVSIQKGGGAEIRFGQTPDSGGEISFHLCPSGSGGYIEESNCNSNTFQEGIYFVRVYNYPDPDRREKLLKDSSFKVLVETEGIIEFLNSAFKTTNDIIIKVSGLTDGSYKILVDGNDPVQASPCVDTKNNSFEVNLGKFLEGSHNIQIYKNARDIRHPMCGQGDLVTYRSFAINNTAPVIPGPAIGPGTTSPATTINIKQCKSKDDPTFNKDRDTVCALSGGQSCDESGGRGPGIKTAIGCIHTNPVELTKDLMKFIIGISGGLAFLMMLLGAFQMLTSAGNPDTLHAGRERLTSAMIGLLIVIFATLLLQIIGFDILKIPGFGR